jgi:hypothetical protein
MQAARALLFLLALISGSPSCMKPAASEGEASGTQITVGGGTVDVAVDPGVALPRAAVMRAFDRAAMTVGYVIVSSEPVEGTLLRHEVEHIRQYERWGPFFIPVYLLLAIPYGYRRHPMELAAMRAAEGR